MAFICRFAGSEGLFASTTSSCGFRTGSERNRIASASVKIAVLAPIPSASEVTVTAVNSGLWRSMSSA
jgi:hypothetical protein